MHDGAWRSRQACAPNSNDVCRKRAVRGGQRREPYLGRTASPESDADFWRHT